MNKKQVISFNKEAVQKLSNATKILLANLIADDIELILNLNLTSEEKLSMLKMYTDRLKEGKVL